MTTAIIHGYDVQNKDKVDLKYRCLVCRNILRNPVQLSCGHRVCQLCAQPQDNDVPCPECQSKTIFSEIRLDKGFLRDMQGLEVHCKLCQWSGYLKSYEDHLEQSHKEFKCGYCREIFNSLTLLEEHEKKTCSKIPMNCILQKFGCKEQFFRDDSEKHYQSEEHQKIALFCIEQIRAQFTEQYRTSATIETNMETDTSDVMHKVTTAPTGVMEKFSDDSNNLHKLIDMLSSGIHILNDELISLRNNSSQQFQSLEATDKLLSTVKTSIEETNDVLTAINTNVLIVQQQLSTLKQSYEDQQLTSYDGTLVWRITKFQDKMTDAKSERQVSIYSPPFWSSPTGYKMRARLYLYGDGNARRTHMSLFFVLMRGPHDSILQFPFSFKVTFCLYDQTNQQRHIIDSFRPDTKSNSFQRPRSEMNIASGIPKFAPLAIFEKSDNPYVKDDTMFIKVMVDFENIPKTVLSYALSLNPALPTQVQHKFIRQEVERRAQQSQPTTQVLVPSNDTKKT